MYNSNKYQDELILLAKLVKKLRKERNLTLKDLAEKSGIRIKYLEKIENGTAIRVSIFKHLLKLAIAFEVKLSDMFDFDKK